MARPSRYLVGFVLLLTPAMLLAQSAVQVQQAQKLYTQALGHESRKQSAKALEAMTEAVKLTPTNDLYVGYLAKLQALNGKHAEAIQNAHKAIALNRINPAYFAIGMRSAAKLQNYEQAADFSAKYLKFGPKLTPADFAEANAILKYAENNRTDRIFGQAVLLHGEAKVKPALGKLREALAKEPKNDSYLIYAKELEGELAAQELDRHALAATPQVEGSIETLAQYLAQGAKNERDKARLIYRWIADRIAYDAESLAPGKRGDNSALGSLTNRKCVCEGYSKLFMELAKAMGMEAVYVNGWSKGGEPGADVKEPKHAWNAVKVDGAWQLVDVTWGAGSTKDGKFTKRLNNYYFLTPPEEFVFTHLPKDAKWQLLDTPVALDDFLRWPRVRSELMLAGASLKDVRARLDDPMFPGFVEVPPQNGPRLRLLQAPLEKTLKAGSTHTFKVRAANFQDVALVYDGKVGQRFYKKGDVFEAEIVVPKGEFLISGKPWDSDNSYRSFLKYASE